MNFFDWLEQVLGGGAPDNQNLGGISGAWSYGLSNYASRAPGVLAPILTTYFTSGVNFDDPSELAEAKSMLDAAAEHRSVSELLQTVGDGEVAADQPAGYANRTIGQVDQATGFAETGTSRGRPFGSSVDPDGPNARRLETLDRWGSSQQSDPAASTAERTLVGITVDPIQEQTAHRTRPESAPAGRPETDAAPAVPASSMVYYGRDSSGNPVYVLGTPPPASAPDVVVRGVRPAPQDDVQEVVVRGVRPPRPPKAPTPRPESRPDTEADADGERGFWDRGGTGLVVGTATGVIGVVLIFSNPVGWVAGLAGALMLAGGAAASLGSSVELGASYAGKTTAAQDAAMNQANAAALSMSSPEGIAGGIAGAIYTGNSRGFEEGAFWGGLAVGAASIGVGIGRIGARGMRFGPRPPVGGAPKPPANPLANLTEAEIENALSFESRYYYRAPVSATEAGHAVESLAPISRWGRPGLRPDDWVMPGPPSRLNYALSFKWDPNPLNIKAPFSAGEGYLVPPEHVRWPSGWGFDGWMKGLFNQRRYVPPAGGR